jgi:hypothetical protein
MRISIDDPIEQDNLAKEKVQAGYLDLEDDVYEEFWDAKEGKSVALQNAQPVTAVDPEEPYESDEPTKANQDNPDDSAQQDSYFQIGFDLNMAKILTVVGLFMLMFGIPVALLNGAFDLDKYRDNPVYTAQLAEKKEQELVQAEIDTQNASTSKGGSKGGQTGQVAGLSTSALAEQSNKLNGKNFMGIPVTTLFILIGLVFIAGPLVYAVK